MIMSIDEEAKRAMERILDKHYDISEKMYSEEEVEIIAKDAYVMGRKGYLLECLING